MAKRYQRSNQNRKQKDKTTQWPKDTNEAIKNRKQKEKTVLCLFFIFLLAIVLFVLLFTIFDYFVGIFWPLCCFVLLFTVFDYFVGIFCCQLCTDDERWYWLLDVGSVSCVQMTKDGIDY
jgi:fatty acid desaturase